MHAVRRTLFLYVAPQQEKREMQIRHVRGRTQFLRTYYVKELKRSKQKLIGSIARGDVVLPDELAAKMTEEEKAEFAAWLDKQREAERESQAAQEIDHLPQSLQNVAGHVMRGVPLSSGQAIGMWEGMAQLRRQLTKAGYTKPHLADKDQPLQEP
jgi:hypothetical protein